MNSYEGKLTPHKNDFLVSDEMLPVRKHQAMDEILQLENQLAGAIYYQRCLEKNL